MINRQIIFAPLVLIAAAAVAYVMIETRPEATKHEVVQRLIKVEAITVTKRPITISVAAQGVASSPRQAQITSEVSGRIIETNNHLVVGGFVHKGDTLIKIDPINYIAQVKQQEAQVSAAKRHLIQEKGQAEVALKDWERAGKPDKTPAAKALSLREPQIKEAEANLAAALAALNKAKNDLANTTIKAPYDGLIANKQVDLGQFISIGSPVIVLQDTSYAEIRLPLAENRLPYINLPTVGQKGKPIIDIPLTLYSTVSNQQHQWQGHIHRTEGSLNNDTRSLYLVARVENPYLTNGLATQNSTQALLRFGSFVQASIPGKTIDGLIPLPRHLLRAGNKLWVIDDNNQLREKTITVLPTDGDTIYVDSGLESGDKICLTPVGNVLPGTKVDVIKLESQIQQQHEEDKKNKAQQSHQAAASL